MFYNITFLSVQYRYRFTYSRQARSWLNNLRKNFRSCQANVRLSLRNFLHSGDRCTTHVSSPKFSFYFFRGMEGRAIAPLPQPPLFRLAISGKVWETITWFWKNLLFGTLKEPHMLIAVTWRPLKFWECCVRLFSYLWYTGHHALTPSASANRKGQLSQELWKDTPMTHSGSTARMFASRDVKKKKDVRASTLYLKNISANWIIVAWRQGQMAMW